MVNSSSGSSNGIGVVGLLGVAFIILKLCGVIHWSWWWVLCPFWGGAAVAIALLLIFGILYLLFGGRDKRKVRSQAQAIHRFNSRIDV